MEVLGLVGVQGASYNLFSSSHKTSSNVLFLIQIGI